ncbi:lytic murein transglycosylase [Agrobacterium pusense]|nr:lytic murein transglycosylase [Agrobacterium pusense]
MCTRLTPLCPAGHLPLKGGDRQEALQPLDSRALSWTRPNRELSGRTEGGKLHPPRSPQ